MNIEQFQSLDWQESLAVIKEHGTLIGQREDGYAKMFLYQIDAFYVELAYTKSDGELWKMGPFDHPILLKPYMDQIDLSGLLP